jgi:hypothetical protein
MGQFSFACDRCGEHDQFDWTDAVVVGLRSHDGKELIHVKGRYGSYGDVYLDLCDGTPSKLDAKGQLKQAPESAPVGSIPVYHKQFEEYFSGWENPVTIVAEEIYCFGGYTRLEVPPFGRKKERVRSPGARSGRGKDKATRSRRDERDDESEGEGEEERLDDQMVKGRRLCVPASTVVNGELPLNYAAKLSKWTETGYHKLQKRELRALMGEPGAGGEGPGCVLM